MEFVLLISKIPDSTGRGQVPRKGLWRHSPTSSDYQYFQITSKVLINFMTLSVFEINPNSKVGNTGKGGVSR